MFSVMARIKLLLAVILLLVSNVALAQPSVFWYNGVQYSNTCRSGTYVFYYAYPAAYPVGTGCTFTFNGSYYHYGIITVW